MRYPYSLILTMIIIVPLLYVSFIFTDTYRDDIFVVAKGDNLESPLEKEFKKLGLVDIQSIDPTIKVDLKYSSNINLLKTDIYGSLKRGYLQKDAAIKLAKAQKELQNKMPGYSLLVRDAARPLRIQYKMWDVVKGTDVQGYIANPHQGSMHNYGIAVDLTIVDDKGVPLDMGTSIDDFKSLSQPRFEKRYFSQGKLTSQQLANRKMLRTVMNKAGFKGILNEWWHFDAFPLDWVRKNLKIIP